MENNTMFLSKEVWCWEDETTLLIQGRYMPRNQNRAGKNFYHKACLQGSWYTERLSNRVPSMLIKLKGTSLFLKCSALKFPVKNFELDGMLGVNIVHDGKRGEGSYWATKYRESQMKPMTFSLCHLFSIRKNDIQIESITMNRIDFF